MNRVLRSTLTTSLRSSLVVLTSILTLSCRHCDDEPAPKFSCADSAINKDVVALACGRKASKDVWEIQAVIGGPTTSADIAGFNFDVVFEDTQLSYVPGSVAALGSFLGSDGDTPLPSAGLASNDPGRLIISIHRNRVAGVQGSATRNLVLTFSMRANSLTPFGPLLLEFENAEAVDSSGVPIGSVIFSEQLLLSAK
jgi:hypothetical protein